MLLIYTYLYDIITFSQRWDRMNNLNICIDIDRTITSLYHFIFYLNEMYNRNIKEEDCTIVNWFKLYDEDNEKFIKKFHDKYMHSY